MPKPTPWKRRLKNYLFIDVKTVAAEPSFSKLDGRVQRLWEQKISRYQREEDWTVGEWYANRASYYAEFGKIVCLGIGGLYFDEDDQPHLKLKTLAGHDERELLGQFLDIVNHYPTGELTLCAHNGKDFDYPYLCRRILVNGLDLPAALQLSGRKPWEIPHQDTLERWQFGDKRYFIPLDLLAATLKVPAKTPEWTGDQTSFVYHEDGDLDRIRQYARDSIVMLVQVYLKMLGAPTIADDHIVTSET